MSEVSKRRPDCEGNVDPKRLDIDQKPKRRRKPITRKREPMPEQAKPWREAARKRKERRPVYPGVILEAAQGAYRVVSPFDDDPGWLDMVADAFGTRSRGVIAMFFDHLTALCQDSYDHSNEAWKPNEQHLNAALAIIHASRPKDELDAMLCAQAVAIHWMQMRASAKLIGGTAGWLDPHMAKVCARLSETFVKQVEAIDRRRRKPRIVRQVITVKRETHFHQHKHVHLEGGDVENDGQGQGTRTGIIEAGAKVPGDKPSGEVVRLPYREGQEGLPNARRRSG